MREREAAGNDWMDIIVEEGSRNQSLSHMLESFSLVIKVSVRVFLINRI